jgi:L,D-transpeptidase ErfK/SrfK
MTTRLLFTLSLYLGAAAAIAAERQFPLPAAGNAVVGANTTTQTSAADTLIDVAVRTKVGYNLIRSANPEVDAWLPGDGTPVLLPYQTILPDAPREGIVINVAEMRLYFYDVNKRDQTGSVTIYPISVGRGEWATPVTTTKVTGKVTAPSWFPPESIRKEHAARGDILPKYVPAGPDNPLGGHLLRLGIPSYFIHGTNKRYGIGMQVTHGCIRMYNPDIEELVSQVPGNATVRIVNQPFKTGWQDGELYLEVHQPLEVDGYFPENSPFDITDAVILATGQYPDAVVDWEMLDKAIKEARGIPVKVGHSPQTAAVNDNNIDDSNIDDSNIKDEKAYNGEPNPYQHTIYGGE